MDNTEGKTTLLSDAQINSVAASIPANVVTLLARAYLELSDTEIENAAGRIPVTLYDVVYKGWKTWTSKHRGGGTVHQASQLLNAASLIGCKAVSFLLGSSNKKLECYISNFQRGKG